MVEKRAPSYVIAHMQLPPNLVFEERESIVDTTKDKTIVDLFRYGFLAGYTGSVPTPSLGNHPLANHHLQDLTVYIVKEVCHGTMLGPFLVPPFQLWCQINPLLIRPKKDSENRKVIMDLSWPHPPGVSINGGTPKDIYLGQSKRMHLPSAHDMVHLIRQAGKGAYKVLAYLYYCDVV